MIETIASAHGRTAAQVALRWIVQQPNIAAIPRTSNVERLAANLAVFDFTLTLKAIAYRNGTEVSRSELRSAGRTRLALVPESTETNSSFTGASTTLHYGRALAIVRSTGETGPVTVTATSTSHGSATIALAAL